MLGAMTLISPGALWPGWLAVVPVMGAVMVLWAARTDSLWTKSHVAQWLGNASYSLYLWHWPLVVVLVYLDAQKNPWAIGAGLLATLGLGFASYAWIELPSRTRLTAMGWRRGTAVLTAAVGTAALLGTVIYLRNGVEWRVDPRTDAIFSAINDKNPRMEECHVAPPHVVPACRYGGPSLGAIVIGDSHAASMVRTVENAMGQPAQHVLDWTYSSCGTLAGVRMIDPAYGDHCGKFVNAALLQQQTMDPTMPLLIVNRTSSYTKGPNDIGREAEFGKPGIYFDIPYDTANPALLTQFRQSLIGTACQFAQVRPVYMLRPIPELRRDVPHTMGRAAMRGRSERVSISLDEYHARHRFVWEAQDAAQAQCGVHILDPLPYLCRDGRCWGDKDGLPLYYDDDHLNERGAALLLPLFQTMFR